MCTDSERVHVASLRRQVWIQPTRQRAGLVVFWVRLKLFFTLARRDSFRAVCMPPGAQLVNGVGEIELVTFTRIQAPGSYRDAVRFKNGHTVGLQDLHEGQRLWVMNLFPRAEASELVLAAVSRV